jgi:uncharacterized protein YuzB (UPF0349 family)
MFSGSRSGRLTAFFCFALLAGCAAAPATHVEKDPQANLHAYKTFSFYEPAGAGTSYASITGNRLKQATREQMQRLGYAYVESNPDLRVNILLRVQDHQVIRSTPPAVGRFGYRGWVSYAVETVHYREGTLAIDLVDTRRNSMVWRGVAGDRITRGEMKNSGVAIDAAVRDLFAQFPRKAAV